MNRDIEYLRISFPDMSDAELRDLDNGCHYTSCENTNAIASDLAVGDERLFHRAIEGRYWICLKLEYDSEYWQNFNVEYRPFSGRLPHEAAVIAAGLAIRPIEPWQWALVEAWAWVYRHAMMLGISIDEFPRWCETQTPETSRVAVLIKRMESGGILAPGHA